MGYYLAIVIAVVLGIDALAFFVIFADEIAAWLEAITKEINAKAEEIRSKNNLKKD